MYVQTLKIPGEFLVDTPLADRVDLTTNLVDRLRKQKRDIKPIEPKVAREIQTYIPKALTSTFS